MTPTKPSKKRISIFSETEAQAEEVRGVLGTETYVFLGPFLLSDMIDTSRPLTPTDAIIIRCQEPETGLFDWIAHIKGLGSRPITLISENADREIMSKAIDVGVDSYVTLGSVAERISASVDLAFARYGKKDALEAQIASLSRTLAERKLTERAKGIVMKERGLPEDEAFRFLQKTAMNRNVRMSDLARTIVEAADLLA